MGAASRTTRAIRLGSLLAFSAFGLHQLRYELSHGGDSGRMLAAEGHGYLAGALPFLAALAVAALLATVLCARLGSPLARRSPVARALIYAFAILAVYCSQELLEGALAAGHPTGLDAVAGSAGWVALPLALTLGAATALVVVALELVEAVLVPPSRDHGRLASSQEFTEPPGSSGGPPPRSRPSRSDWRVARPQRRYRPTDPAGRRALQCARAGPTEGGFKCSPTAARAVLLVVLAAVAVVLFVVLSGGDDDDGGSDDHDRRPQPRRAPRPRPPEPQFEVITMKNGEPVGGVQELEYTKGDQIRIEVRLDEPQEDVHIHGYDIEKLNPSGTVRSSSSRRTSTGSSSSRPTARSGDVVLAEIVVNPLAERMSRRAWIAVTGLALMAGPVAELVLPESAAAHALVGRQDLPIPTWLFAWGASLVLIVSFALLSVAWKEPRLQRGSMAPVGRLALGRRCSTP